MIKKESSIKLLFVATVGLFLAVVSVGIVEIKKISSINKIENACGGDGVWITNSATGKSTYVTPTTYVEKKVAVSETATTSYGVNYSKEGQMTLLDADCDVKEAFEILDCVRMHVKIKFGDVTYYQAYAKGSDGYTYLVETDEFGNISRDSEGNAKIIKRCDFVDLYLGEE
jgi:hypothetical protein